MGSIEVGLEKRVGGDESRIRRGDVDPSATRVSRFRSASSRANNRRPAERAAKWQTDRREFRRGFRRQTRL